MARDSETQFREKQQLVTLFRAQLDALQAADPAGAGRLVQLVNVGLYDNLLAKGPKAAWPMGVLSGLKQGIRDAQLMLDMAYPGPRRLEVRRQLRASCGDAVNLLEAQDSKRVATIRKRGRIGGEDEYYLVVGAIDRLEAQPAPDQELLRELRHLAQRAQIT